MDETAFYILISIGSILLVLNLVATYIVFTTYFEVKQRKYYQLIFVWLIPFVGAVFAIYFNRKEPHLIKFKRKIGNEPDNFEGIA